MTAPALAVACPLCGTAIPLAGLSAAEADAVRRMVAADGCWSCWSGAVPDCVPSGWVL